MDVSIKHKCLFHTCKHKFMNNILYKNKAYHVVELLPLFLHSG